MKTFLILLTLVVNFTIHAQVTSNLTAHYKFNGNVEESVAGRHGAAYNCLYTTDRSGNPLSAIYIQGTTNSYAKLSNSSALKNPSGAVSLWVNVDEINDLGSGFDYNPIILAKNDVNATSYFEAYCLYIKRGDKKFLTITTRGSNNAERYIFSNTTATIDNWHHLVMNYNYDSLWFYVDNVLQKKIVRGFDQDFDISDSILLGATQLSNNQRYFTGAIDDVRIYKNILSLKQVDTLFNIAAMSNVREVPLTSIDEYLIYPNPSNGIIYFNPALSIARYEVYDATGKLITQGAAEKSIDLTEYKGIYTLRCFDKELNVRTETLILH